MVQKITIPKELAEQSNDLYTLLPAGFISVEKQLPEIGTPVVVFTDYGKMDVCRLRIDDNRVIVWVNDMRPQHTNGSVIGWLSLPACR